LVFAQIILRAKYNSVWFFYIFDHFVFCRGLFT
jgi:hypothetical protein